MLTPPYQKALTALVTKFERDLQAVNRAITIAVLDEVQRSVGRAVYKTPKAHVDLSSLDLALIKAGPKRSAKPKATSKPVRAKAKPAKPAAKSTPNRRIKLQTPEPVGNAKLKELGAALAAADAEAEALAALAPMPAPAPAPVEPEVIVLDTTEATLPEESTETLDVEPAIVPTDALVVAAPAPTPPTPVTAQIAPGKRCPRCHRIAPKPTGYCIMCNPKPDHVTLTLI